MTDLQKAQKRLNYLLGSMGKITEVDISNGKLLLIFEDGRNLAIAKKEVTFQAEEYDNEKK